MPPSPDRIFQVASAVKLAIIDGFADALVDLPDRAYVTYGLPAHDCAQLAVSVETTASTEGPLGQEIVEPVLGKPGHAMRFARLAITLIRCVPTVNAEGETVIIPTADEEEEAAETVLTDAQLLLNVIVAAQRSGDLPRCGGVAFEQWQAITPNGGLGGGILRVRLLVE